MRCPSLLSSAERATRSDTLTIRSSQTTAISDEAGRQPETRIAAAFGKQRPDSEDRVATVCQQQPGNGRPGRRALRRGFRRLAAEEQQVGADADGYEAEIPEYFGRHQAVDEHRH